MRPTAPRRHDVQKQEDKTQVVAQGRTQGCTSQAHAHGEGEQPAQGGVDRGTDDEHDHAGIAVALGLQEPLDGLEGTISGQADEAVYEELARLDCKVVLLDKQGQYPGREDPYCSDGDQREPHEQEHPLDVQADTRLVPGSVGLGTQCVQGRCHALQDGQADDVHGGGANARGSKVICAEVAGNCDGNHEEGVLEEIGGDEGQRVSREKPQLDAPVGMFDLNVNTGRV